MDRGNILYYTETRLTTVSTDQSLRRPYHQTVRPRRNNCLIDCCRYLQKPFYEPVCLPRNITRLLAKEHLVSRCRLRVLPMTPNHRCLNLKWCRARWDWAAKGMELGRPQ
ncbi:hypothetical protein TNCV_946621 [Trichonephila clavipes]|nr:hypothetical protein TNCV_946621 [Trichonephila clavipes]